MIDGLDRLNPGRWRYTLSTLCLLWACGSAPLPDTPTPTSHAASQLAWSPLLENDPSGLFMSAWGTDDGEIWIVGGQAESGSLLRGHLEALTPIPLPPGTPLINWVHGSGPNDIWLVGLHGAALHWDGDTFTDHSIDMDEALWGVFVRGPEEAIAVGGASRFGGDNAIAFHWSGDTWRPITLPEEASGLSNLLKVTFDGSEYWVVGEEGIALRGQPDGLTIAPTQTAASLVTAHGEGAQLMVVGGRGTGIILGRGDDDTLSPVMDARAGLSGLHVLDSGDAIVVGERGYGALYDPETGTLTESPFETNHLLHGVFAHENVGILAMGGNFYGTDAYEGTLLWSPLPPR